MERFKGIKTKEIHPANGPPFGFPVFDTDGNEMMAIKETNNKNIFEVGFEDLEIPSHLNFILMSKREIKKMVNDYLKYEEQTYYKLKSIS